MISKELLSEVLGCDSSECYFEDTYNLINYKYQYDVTWSEEIQYDNSSINIHELAHKCKEWLKNNVSNSFSGFDNGHRFFCHIENYNIQDRFYEDTEPEAIFKACQWILENKEMK